MAGKSGDVLAIVVGGGPAPGINGVIHSVTIEAINEGLTVLGIYDGFKWLAQGNTEHVRPLSIEDVSRIHLHGGSILRTSRENPTKDPDKMRKTIESLRRLGVSYLVTIGGDDTAFTASQVWKHSGGQIRVAHVPKTIDNDLPLPENMPTFGFETARHVGARLVQNLMEDSRTTGRWYFVISMGREAGHLALGMAKAAGATLAVIPEEFPEPQIRLQKLVDILEGAILKRLSMGRPDGVAVIAEGLAEKLRPEDLEDLKEVERDEFGHIRLSEIDLGRVLKNAVRRSLKARGLQIGIVSLDIGYELRSADPIAFDIEYTRNLGYGAVRFLLSGGSGAMIAYVGGHLRPIPFDEIMDPQTGRTRVRLVNIRSESYEVASKYMIRLTRKDFEDPEKIRAYAAAGNMTPEQFLERFGYLRDELPY